MIKTSFVLALACGAMAGLAGCWGPQRDALPETIDPPPPPVDDDENNALQKVPASPSASSKSQQPPPDPQAIERGKDASVTCAGCHGANGEGNPALGFTLAGSDKNYLIQAIRAYRTGGKRAGKGPKAPMMLPIADPLSDDEIKNLAAYYSSLPMPNHVSNPSPYNDQHQ